MRTEQRLRAVACELAPLLDTRVAPAFVYVLATGASPRTARIWALWALRAHKCGHVTTFSVLVNPRMDIPPEGAAAAGIRADCIARSETFDEVRPWLDAFLADSPVISVDPAQIDTQVLERQYWDELWRNEGGDTTRKPELPNLERPGPDHTRLDVRRADIAAALGLAWACRPGHSARRWAEGYEA